MQTHFSDSQRADPAIQVADAVLRKCVHCGFCTATCPTYRITGDELESPRGRISLIQNLLESGDKPTPETVANLDHCLSCLSCESTCPSGVSYRRLIDQGREIIEQKYRRPLADRALRALLAWLLPRPNWFRRALLAGRLSKPVLHLAGNYSIRMAALARLVPDKLAAQADAVKPGVYLAEGQEQKRVALITGCVQSVLAPDIDAATIRVLTRHGCTVIVPESSPAGCCGALPHHLGKSALARIMARQNLATWHNLLNKKSDLLNEKSDLLNEKSDAFADKSAKPVDAGTSVDAILMTASGCGAMLKDYDHLLRDNDNAKQLSIKIKDLSQILADLFTETAPKLTDQNQNQTRVIAWQNPCSLQHGLKEKNAPIRVLQACGFTVKEPRDAHLCCGSAGTYNLLQPQFAQQLRDDKATRLRETGAEFVVSGNIGCITQLTTAAPNSDSVRVLHLAQLVDWATGGPTPEARNLAPSQHKTTSKP